MIRFRHRPTVERRVLAIALASVIAVSCSGGNDAGNGSANGSGAYDDAVTAYAAAARERASTVGTALAAAYLGKLTPDAQDPAIAVLEEHQEQVTSLGEYLCQRVAQPVGRAGSGDARSGRLDQLFATSRQIVQDAMATALLNGALAAAADRREQLLDLLGVKATASDGTMLRGADALRDAGLEPQGSVELPATGTPEYTKYRDWAAGEAPAFEGTVVTLTDDVRGQLEQCIFE